QAKHSIIELSKIMRYVLYDTSGQTVWLSKELQFTNNYITLMSIRYDDSVDIKLNVQPNIPDIKIPPLLIQPFVENAFKHGISSIKQSFIHIDLSVDNNQLVCNVVNSNNHKNEDSGGIGLENIQKRLQLLFGDKYSLKIENTAETYTTTLTIPTSNDTMYSN
ncbi:MAG: histidine kinase, partial [Rikenellaceae bacterium]|nr:histidine kinase [Rikenellaceae bacterium]